MRGWTAFCAARPNSASTFTDRRNPTSATRRSRPIRSSSAVRNDHPLARRKSVDWADLKGYPLIGFSRHSGNYAILDHALANRNLDLNWFYEANHLSTTLGLLEANLGVAILPGVSIPQVRNSVIVSIPVSNPVVTRTIGIVERRFGQLSAAASLFRSMLMESQKPKPERATSLRRSQRSRSASASR